MKNVYRSDEGSNYMAAVEYKEFMLLPSPYQFIDTKDWVVSVIITKQNGGRGETREKRFFSDKLFSEKMDACHTAIQFGKEVIDGMHANLSVVNL
jgi:hypothetical protein